MGGDPSHFGRGRCVKDLFGVAFMMVGLTRWEVAVDVRVVALEAGVMPDCKGWADLRGKIRDDRGTIDAGVIGMARQLGWEQRYEERENFLQRGNV